MKINRTKAPKTKGTKYRYYFSGGPYHRICTYLHSAGTLPFCVGNECGHYNQSNKWIPSNAN